MTTINKVCNILGLKLYEQFTVRPSKIGKILGHKPNENIVYRFDTSLVHKSYDDNGDEWYGGGNEEKILYYLILDLYEIVRKEMI